MSRPPASLTRSLATGTPTSPPAEPVEVSLPLRVAVVVIAGAALGLSWEPYGLWPSAAWRSRIHTRRPWVAAACCQRARLSVWSDHADPCHQLGACSRNLIAVLLIIFMALYFGVLGLALALVSRLRCRPLAAACCLVLIEYTYSRIPFGLRLDPDRARRRRHTAGRVLPDHRSCGVSFVVALLGQLVALIVLTLWTARRRRPAQTSHVVIATVAAVILVPRVGLAALPGRARCQYSRQRAGRDRAGKHPGRGIEAMGRARSVTNNHLSETIRLMTSTVWRGARPGFPALA